jgi:hypothetical protein
LRPKLGHIPSAHPIGKTLAPNEHIFCVLKSRERRFQFLESNRSYFPVFVSVVPKIGHDPRVSPDATMLPFPQCATIALAAWCVTLLALKEVAGIAFGFASP